MKIKSLLKKTVSLLAVASMSLSGLCITTVMAEEEETFDPSGAYHASMGIQTCTKKWLNRQAYYDEGINQYYGTDMNNSLWAGSPSAAGEIYSATFNDIEIAGNGTYTLSIENADFSEEKAISQLYIATDIPYTEDIVVTDFIITINGKKFVSFDTAELEDEDKYLAGGMIILAINHWRDTLVETLEELGKKEDDPNGINLLNGNGNESIVMTFTISGFDYDNPEAVAPTTEAPTTEAPTTEAPTTEAPTTEAPATEAPTTEIASASAEATTTVASATTAATIEKSTESSEKTDSSKKSNTGLIIGISAVVVILLVITIVFMMKKKK